MRLATKCIFGVLIGVTVYFGSQVFLPWSPLNCWCEEIGLDTGKVRHSHYLFFISVSSNERPSELTKALATPSSATESRWQRVNTFSPGVSHSPHHRYHGALSQISSLHKAWNLKEFTPQAKRLTAQALLDRWRDGGSDDAADQLISDIIAIEKNSVTEHDVQPLIDKNNEH